MATKKNKNKFNYFKVNEKILDTDIKKSELWVYLTHCRSRGIKSIGRKVRGNQIGKEKNVIYSTASLTRVRDFFGNKINERAYKKAIGSLEEKGLIYAVDIEKTGLNKKWYKSKEAIEIIEPKNTLNIQLPVAMLDNKVFTSMSVKEIKTIIELYKNYDYGEDGLGAISKDCIMAYDTNNKKGYRYLGVNFGGGFNRSIYEKRAIAVTDFNYIETDIDIDALNRLVESKLFNFKPVLRETDPEEEELFELKYELFKDLVGFSNTNTEGVDYITAELKENESIVWVLEPSYRVEIEPTQKYFENHDRAYQRATLLYAETDLLTDERHRRYGLYYEETYIQAETLLDSNTFEKILAYKKELYRITGESSMYMYCKEHNLNSLYDQHIQECFAIKEQNKRLKAEEGYRSRSESSPRLRALDKEIEKLENVIAEKKPMIDELEKELLDLIPIKAMESFFFESEGYQSENVGKVTRLIS